MKMKFKNFASDELFEKHFNKHKYEYSDLTREQYINRARELLNSPVKGDILGFTNKKGFVFRYDSQNNDFSTGKPDGTIETLFKPNGELKYWKEQIKIFGSDLDEEV